MSDSIERRWTGGGWGRVYIYSPVEREHAVVQLLPQPSTLVDGGPSSVERADFLRVRSEGRGTRRSPANVLRVALAHRPPDCRPKEPQVTQNAPNARRPIARNPSVLVQPLPPVMDELTLGGPGRSGRCTRRVLDSSLHCIRQFTCAARRPQRPTLPRRRLRVHTRWVTRRLVLRPRPPTRPRPSNPRALRMSSGSRASG